MKANTIVALLFAGAWASPALPNWQYTTWEMSPAQVIAASSGQAHQVSVANGGPNESTKAAEGNFIAADRAFATSFYFTEQKLRKVSLSLHGVEACNQTVQDMQAVYGAPSEAKGGMVATATWLDRVHANRVKIIQTLDYCQIDYSPLASAAASQL